MSRSFSGTWSSTGRRVWRRRRRRRGTRRTWPLRSAARWLTAVRRRRRWTSHAAPWPGADTTTSTSSTSGRRVPAEASASPQTVRPQAAPPPFAAELCGCRCPSSPLPQLAIGDVNPNDCQATASVFVSDAAMSVRLAQSSWACLHARLAGLPWPVQWAAGHPINLLLATISCAGAEWRECLQARSSAGHRRPAPPSARAAPPRPPAWPPPEHPAPRRRRAPTCGPGSSPR